MSDPVRLQLMKDLFGSVAEEMGTTLERTGLSPNIKERRDFSCAVFDGAARLIAQAAHIPVHLGSMASAVESAVAQLSLAPGDEVLVNDPFAGGTHLPDLTLVTPVFLDGARAPGAGGRRGPWRTGLDARGRRYRTVSDTIPRARGRSSETSRSVLMPRVPHRSAPFLARARARQPCHEPPPTLTP